MAVRAREAMDRVSAHQEPDQLAVVDERDPLGPDPFVVEAIEPVELSTIEGQQRWIVVDRQPGWGDLLADVRSEGLTARGVLLTVAFDSVPEHLVKEHPGGAALQDRWPHVRL